MEDVKAALDPCDAHPLNANAVDLANVQIRANLMHEILQAHLV